MKGLFFAKKHRDYWLLGLLIVVTTGINLWWIIQDQRPQPVYDSYPANTLQGFDRLQKGDLAHFPFRLLDQMSVGARPPLYQVLALPYLYVFGRDVRAMLLLNLTFYILLVYATYQIGKLAFNKRAGLLSALLIATYPPIVNLTKIARPHAVLPAWAALLVWLLLLLIQTRSWKIAWLLGVTLGLSFWIHFDAITLSLVPVTLGCLYTVFFQGVSQTSPPFKRTSQSLLTTLADPFVRKGLLPAALLCIGITAVWYAHRWHDILAFGRGIQNVAVSSESGNMFTIFGQYAATLPGAISSVQTALFVISLIVHLLVRKFYPLLLTILFFLMFGIMSMRMGRPHLIWAHFAGVLPLIAVLTASGLIQLYESVSKRIKKSSFRILPVSYFSKTFTTLLFIVCIAGSGVSFSIVTWGFPGGYNRSFFRLLGIPQDTTCESRMNVAFCPNPPRRENWRMSAILQSIGDDHFCNVLLQSSHFELTRDVLWWLRYEGLPENIVQDLKPLKEQVFVGQDAFLEAIERHIGQEHLRTYRPSILEFANQDRPGHTCSLTVVTVNAEFHNKNLEYYRVRDFPTLRLNIVESFSANLNWLLSDYLVYIPQLQGQQPAAGLSGLSYEYANAVVAFLEEPGSIFHNAHREIAQIPLPHGWTVRVIKRAKPLTLKEAEEAIGILGISDKLQEQFFHEVLECIDQPNHCLQT